MRFFFLSSVLSALAISGCAASKPNVSRLQATAEVEAAERAFAKTLADRDHAAFTSFLGEDAVFFDGAGVKRGKAEIAAAWKPLFAKPDAPFSWAPAQVEVLDSGTLALSTGPIRTPDGKIIATYNSIWRLDAPGVWRVVFDKGSEVCNPGIKSAQSGSQLGREASACRTPGGQNRPD